MHVFFFLAASNPSDQVPAADSTRTDFAQGTEIQSPLFVPEMILFLTKNLTFLVQVSSWTFFSLNEFTVFLQSIHLLATSASPMNENHYNQRWTRVSQVNLDCSWSLPGVQISPKNSSEFPAPKVASDQTTNGSTPTLFHPVPGASRDSPSLEIKDISSPLTIISGISYHTPEQ